MPVVYPYIYEDAERLAKRYGTRDPFELLDAMNVVVKIPGANNDKYLVEE